MLVPAALSFTTQPSYHFPVNVSMSLAGTFTGLPEYELDTKLNLLYLNGYSASAKGG